MNADPLQYGWWLGARTAGIVGLVAVSASVATGLYVATRGMPRRPGAARLVADVHRQLAIVGLLATALHGIALLGDPWLRPGPAGVLVPGAIGYRPGFVAAGIAAAYGGILLGASYALRRRIGTLRWRRLHRLTLLVYALVLVHAFGAGTDAGTIWLRAIAAGAVLPAMFNLVLRLGRRAPRRAAKAPTLTL